MKKIILTLAICGIAIIGNSQQSSDGSPTGLGVNGTGVWTVITGTHDEQFQMNESQDQSGNSFSSNFPVEINVLLPKSVLVYKNFYPGGIAFRSGLALGRIHEDAEYSGSAGIHQQTVESTSSIRSFSIGLSAGLEKHLEDQSEKIDPYFGSDLMLSYVTGLRYERTEDIYNPGIKGDSYTSHNYYATNYPGALGLSLQLFTGFNYFISPMFSIGAEAGVGGSALNMRGNVDSDYTGASTSGTTTTTATIIGNSDKDDQVTGFALNSFGRINLTYYW